MTPGLASIDINIDPVLHLGGLAIHWYGVMYAAAFAVGLYFGAIPHLARRGIDRSTVERYTVWAIIAGLVGARLYYVVQSSPPQGGSWFSHPEEIPAVWHGGMAFFGAVIAAPLAIMVLAWRERHNWWLIADAAAVFAVLGQPIGRIGNVINGDILGHASSLPWAVSYSNPNAILQSGFVNCSLSRQLGQACTTYEPAAVYEALGTLVILGVLFMLRARRNPPAGTLWLIYLGLYAISQLLIFFTRGSEPVVGLGMKQAQWTAIVFGVAVVPVLTVARRRGLFNWAPAGTESGALADPPAAVVRDGLATRTLPGHDDDREDGGASADNDVIPGEAEERAARQRRELRRRARLARPRPPAVATPTGGGDPQHDRGADGTPADGTAADS